MILKNILFIPEFHVNLIFVVKLLNKGFSVIFENKYGKIFKNNKLFTKAIYYKNLYLLFVKSNNYYIYLILSNNKYNNKIAL